MSIPNRIAVLNANGTTDTSFAPGAGLDAAGYSVQAYPEGVVLAGGAFAMVSGSVQAKLAFFDADGTLQAGTPTPNNTVRTLALQTDGSVLFGGEFTSVDGATRNRIARLESDLTLEAAYDPNAGGTVYGLLNQEDGKTLAVGAFTTMGGTGRNRIARLYNDSAPTTLSVQSVDSVQWLRGGASPETERVLFELSTDGGTTYSAISGTTTRVAGGWSFVPAASLTGTGIIRARAFPTDSQSEGTVDETVSFDVSPEIEVTNNGVILVDAVSTVAYDDLQLGSTTDKVITVTNIGLTNLTFSGTHVTLATGTQWSVVSQPASPVTPGSSVNFTLRFAPTSAGAKTDVVTIHNNDSDEGTFTFNLTGTSTPGPGSLDSTWQVTANALTYTSAQKAANTTWIGGNFTTVNALTRQRYAAISVSGSVQSQTGSITNSSVLCVCHLPNGQVLVGGDFTSVSGVTRNRLARFNADGSFDASFNISANGIVNTLLLQADGSVIVGGYFTTLGGVSRSQLGKLTPSGALDTSFNQTMIQGGTGVAVQTDGKIFVSGYLGGSSAAPRVVRLNADGSADSTFSVVLTGAAPSNVTVDADGKVLIGGTYTSIGGTSKRGLNRLTSVGALDATFTEVQAAVQSVVLQCDGKVIAGSFTAGSLASTERLVRLSTTGSNDTTFVASARNAVYGLGMQSDGKVIVTGNFTLAGGTTRYVARLLNDSNAASSSLSVVDATSVQWLRGGTAPETQIVVFHYSQDSGVTWTRLGQGSRITGGWSLSSIALPISGILRAQAYISCGYNNGSTSIHEEQVSFSNLAVPDLVVEYPVGTVITDGGTVSFPGTLPGQTADITFTLRNTGLATLTGISVTSAGDFTITSSPATSLVANGTTALTVRFAPSTTGARGPIFLTIASSLSGAKNPYTIGMNGNGVAVPVATTGASTSPGAGQRTLNGTFRANHDTATAYFQYKLAAATTWTDSASSTLSGFTNVAVAKTITGLASGQSYQYRAIIYNAVNAGQAPASPFVGATSTFTT